MPGMADLLQNVTPSKTALPKHITALSDSKASGQLNGRTIVCLFDGTGDKFDNDNTNVVRLLSALKKGDPAQLVYYQTGIGTTSSNNGVKKGFSGIIDMAVGSGLGFHIQQGYRFLMQNYKEGDRINLFGFSRGAYTARALAGMLFKCGLLPKDNPEQVDFAYEMYKRSDPESAEMAIEFKKTFSIEVPVHFCGVWDTVASVGGLIPRTLPFTASNNGNIRTFRHALSLDEHRSKFKANHFMKHVDEGVKIKDAAQQTADEKGFGGPLATTVAKMALESPTSVKRGRDKQVRRLSMIRVADKEALHCTPSMMEAIEKQANEQGINGGPLQSGHPNGGDGIEGLPKASSSASGTTIAVPSQHRSAHALGHQAEMDFLQLSHFDKAPVKTDVIECYFLGCHCDVGGGAVPNDIRQALANIPLRWMVRETFKCNTGIIYDSLVLESFKLDTSSLYPKVVPRTAPLFKGPSPMLMDTLASSGLATNAGSASPSLSKEVPYLGEYVEDYFDSLAEINDMLVNSKAWWILEFLPIKRFTQNRNGTWTKRYLPNLGKYRTIRDAAPKIHWTVLNRHEQAAYSIQNEVDHDAKWEIIY